ncbi:unnamed protein product [Effrenium voratum]|nr:unnamed protein product [Effrenium voratum]
MEEHPAGAFRSGGAAFFFVLRHSCYARVGDGAGPLHQASSGVKEWAEKYKRARAEAERDPNILTQPAQDFERAPASQMGARLRGGSEAANAQRHSTQEDGSQAIDIKSMWAPQWLAASQSFSLPVFEDTQPSPQSMAEQMQKFRKKIDDTFGWTGKLLDDSQIAFRAAAQAILLQSGRTQERLLEASAEDARSELLQCKVFSLLAGEMYRSHGSALFEYGNGSWSVAVRGVTSVGLEFLLMALRRAQAYLAAMAAHKPARSYVAMSFELGCIRAAGGDAALLEWQLNDVAPKKIEARAKDWLVGLSELCRSLRHAFSEHNKTILRNFHRWSDEDLDAEPGLSFVDAYISTVDGQLRQLKKDPRHWCYLGIPTSLSVRPSDATRIRYAKIILSSFAGGDGLRVLLDQCCLVVAGVRQPDVLHIVTGQGHDGKTLIFVDHMRAVFGSGFGCAPCAMLQTEREFQQQGLNFIHCGYMVFDESKRDQGIVEDQVKLYVGGGRIPLRRNHEAETKYAQWSCTAKVWNMNVGDIPFVPTAEERSHARRYRCTFMRSKFTNDVGEINFSEKTFMADPNAKAFMASGEAVWCFYNDFLFPHMQKYGALVCSDNLEFTKQGSSTAKDTAWLLRRMMRTSKETGPEELANGVAEDTTQAAASPSEVLVKDTHRAISSQFFSSADVGRASVASNPGVLAKPGRAGAPQRKTRVECLKEAILEYPNLIRVVEGQVRSGVVLDRFERRQVDVCEWEGILAGLVEGRGVEEVFGGWWNWRWGPSAVSWVEPLHGSLALPDGDPWHLFVQQCHADGVQEEDGLLRVRHIGRQKVVEGAPLGRHFFGPHSYPCLSRQARAAAYPAASKEFDMPNAIVYFACQVGDAHGVTMPLFRKYVAHKAAWRSAVSKWLDLSLEDAKKMLLKACYGFSLPSRSGGSSKVCPLLDGLAREGLELREAVCTAYPGLVEAMCLARRPRPETSAVAMLLLDLENRWMRGFVELLPRHNFRLVASIFDAVVALPTAQADEEGLLEEFQDLCGLAMQVRPACPPAFCDGVREALARLTAAGKGVLDAQTETVAGEAMCIPTAVINLFPCAAASVKMSMSGKQGPLSYSQFLDLCPDFVIEALPVADAAAAQDNASFLLHEGRVQQSHPRHVFRVLHPARR